MRVTWDGDTFTARAQSAADREVLDGDVLTARRAEVFTVVRGRGGRSLLVSVRGRDYRLPVRWWQRWRYARLRRAIDPHWECCPDVR